MSDTQSVFHVVMRYEADTGDNEQPVKLFEDRKDARNYVSVMNRESDKYGFYVFHKGVKLG